MSTKNCFCGGCGNPLFNGELHCRSCCSDESRRGFLEMSDSLDDWYYPDFDDVEASDFEIEVASLTSEPVSTIVDRGFHLVTPEQELVENNQYEIELASMVKSNWGTEPVHQSEQLGSLGA